MEKLGSQLHEINEMEIAQQSNILLPQKLNPEVVQLLNQRLGDEYTAHYFYRNAANWCKDKAYFKAAAYFEAEAASELTHAEKLQNYLTDWNIVPFIPPVKMVPSFSNLIDIVNKAYELEFNLLGAYNVNSAQVFTTDLTTFDFLQQLRQIQMTSVAEYSDLLNAAQLINVSNNFEVLYYEGKYFKG